MPFTLIPQNSISGGVGDSLRPNAKPLIINGNMAVAQRDNSFADVANGAYTLDRYRTSVSDDGAITITQEALTSGNAYNDGFRTALKCDVTTADTSMTGNQKFWVQQIIEAQNLQVLKYGTSSAEKLTLAFWVKATKTGTNVVRLYAFDDDRSVSASYTISQSDTWEHKVLNIPADTTGVIDNNNEPGIQISWALAAGADFQSGTLATTWGANTTANDFVGQVNHMDSTSNNFHITGIQLEVGEYTSSTLPPFQHESYGDNLARCQRYFTMVADGRLGGGSNEAFIGAGYCHAGNTNYFACGTLPVRMRTIDPSIFTVTGTNNYKAIREDGEDTFDSIIMYGQYNQQVFSINCTGNVSATQGTGAQIRLHSTSTYFGVDAEL